jgi:hypothetical protein
MEFAPPFFQDIRQSYFFLDLATRERELRAQEAGGCMAAGLEGHIGPLERLECRQTRLGFGADHGNGLKWFEKA